MQKSIVFLFLVLFSFSIRPVLADESYADHFNHKFQRGFVNTLLGWSKIFTVPYEKSPQDSNAWATFGRGLYEGIGATVAGFFNFIFSPTPLNEMPYPGGGVFER